MTPPGAIVPTGSRVTLVPGGQPKPAEQATPQPPQAASPPPAQTQPSKAEQAVEAKLQRWRVAVAQRIYGAKDQLTSEELKRRGYGEAGTGFFDAAGVEDGETDNVVIKEEFLKGLKAAMPSDVIRTLTAQGKSPEEIAEAILKDYKTAKQIKWVACQKAAEEYAGKYGTTYYENQGLKIQEWLNKGCNPGLKEAAASLAKAMVGEIKPESRLTTPQFALILYSLAILSSMKEPKKSGFAAVANLEGDSPEAVLRWVTKGSGTEVTAAEAGEASAAGEGATGTSSAIERGNEKMRSVFKQGEDGKLKLQEGVTEQAAVEKMKAALQDYKEAIRSSDKAVSEEAGKRMQAVIGTLARMRGESAITEYLPDLIEVYREKVNRDSTDIDSKAQLRELLYSQSSAYNKLAKEQGISGEVKVNFERLAKEHKEEAVKIAKELKDYFSREIKTTEDEIAAKTDTAEVARLTAKRNELKAKLEALRYYSMPVAGQDEFYRVLGEEKFKFVDIRKAYDDFCIELGKAIEAEEKKGVSADKDELLRLYAQMADLQINRRSYDAKGKPTSFEKAAEYDKKMVALYDQVDAEGKKFIRESTKKIVNGLIMFRHSSRAILAKGILEELSKKDSKAIGEMELEIHKANNKKGKKDLLSADKETIKVSKPGDIDSFINARFEPLAAEEASQFMEAAKKDPEADDIKNAQGRKLIRLNKLMLFMRAAYIVDDKTIWNQFASANKNKYGERDSLFQGIIESTMPKISGSDA